MGAGWAASPRLSFSGHRLRWSRNAQELRCAVQTFSRSSAASYATSCATAEARRRTEPLYTSANVYFSFFMSGKYAVFSCQLLVFQLSLQVLILRATLMFFSTRLILSSE